MQKNSTGTTYTRADRRRVRVWNLLQRPLRWWLRRTFNFTHDDFDPGAIEGPLIVVINHTCAYDPLFVGIAFKNKPLSFIASEHLLRIRPWGKLIDRYFYIIPHRKGRGGNSTSKISAERIARGESVFLCPEGEQTWNGISMPVKAHTGSMVKRSGATLVTYKIEGAYLAVPRWSSRRRKGKVYSHPVRVYSPEELSGMSAEQVEEAINRDLSFDVWKWQREKPGGPARFKCSGRAAEGLEKAVFSCPACGKIGTLQTKGDDIFCSCGFKLRWSETGFFDPAQPFETIADWEAQDRDTLRRLLRENDLKWKPDSDVLLRQIHSDHTHEELCRSALSVATRENGPAITIGGKTFPFSDIKKMSLILSGRIVFTTRNGYYEIRAEKANLRKYVTAWEIVRESEE